MPHSSCAPRDVHAPRVCTKSLVCLQGAAKIPASTIQEAAPQSWDHCKHPVRSSLYQARTLATSTATWLEEKPSPRQFRNHGIALEPCHPQGERRTCSWPSRKPLPPQPALVHGSCVALPPLNGAMGQEHLHWFKLVWARRLDLSRDMAKAPPGKLEHPCRAKPKPTPCWPRSRDSCKDWNLLEMVLMYY